MRLSRLDYTIYAVIAVIAMAGSLVVRPRSMTWLLPTVVVLGLAAIGCNWLIEKLRNEEPSEMRTRSALFTVGAIISTVTSIVAMQLSGPIKRASTYRTTAKAEMPAMESAAIFDSDGNFSFRYRTVARISKKEYALLEKELLGTSLTYLTLTDVWEHLELTRELLITMQPGTDVSRRVQNVLRDLDNSIERYTKDKELMLETVLQETRLSTDDPKVLALITRNDTNLRRFYQKLDAELHDRQQELHTQAEILVEMASFPDRWNITQEHADLRTEKDQTTWNNAVKNARASLNALEFGYPLYLGYRIFLTRINRLTD